MMDDLTEKQKKVIAWVAGIPIGFVMGWIIGALLF